VAFVEEKMVADIRIHHMPELGSWTVEARQLGYSAAGTSEWGTSRRHAGDLLADALNSRVPQIFDTFKDTDGGRRVLNVVDTEAARDKLQRIMRFRTGSGPTPIALTAWRAITMIASTISRRANSTAPISNFLAPLAPSLCMGTRSAASGGSSPMARPISPLPSAPARP